MPARTACPACWVVLGIEDQADAARQFAKAYEMSYRILIGKATGFPFIVTVDRNSKPIFPRIGRISLSELMASAEAVLN